MKPLEAYQLNKKQVIAKLVEICQQDNVKYNLVEMQGQKLHSLRSLLFHMLCEKEDSLK